MPRIINSKLDVYVGLLIFGCFLGSKLFVIDVGPQLSIYRLCICLFPFFWRRANMSFSKASACQAYYKFLCFWFVYSIIISPFVVDFGAFFTYLFFLFGALVTTKFVSIFVNNKNRLLFVLRLFETCAFIFSVIGLYELFTGDYRFVSESNRDLYGASDFILSTFGLRIPISAFYNPNDFALFLVFSFFISLFLTRLKEKKFDKLLSVFATCLFLFLLVATQSRAAFLSVLIGLLIVFFFWFRNSTTVNKIMVITLIVIFSSSIVSWLISNEVLYRDLITIDINEGSDQVRINLIKNGLLILKKTWFLGTGIGNVEGNMVGLGLNNTEGVTNIHNWWMEVLVSSGVVVFLYYVVLYARYLFFFIKELFVKQSCGEDYIYCLMSTCLMSSFILASVTSSSNFRTEWMWGIFAIVFSIPSAIKNESGHPLSS